MPNLNTIKTAKLRKMAEAKEIEGFEDMERKELIEALAPKPKEKPKEEPKEKKKEKEEGGEKKPKVPEVPEDKSLSGIEEGRVATGSKAERMKAKLAKQPKMIIMIPLDKGEKQGSTFSVILNGYRQNIQKGVYVPVAEQVARIIMESQKQTVAALTGGLNLDNPNHPKRKRGLDLRDLD